MLLNPYQGKEPFTLPHLMAWLEQQPADQKYYWPSCRDCLMARYIQAMTGCAPEESTTQAYPNKREYIDFQKIAGGSIPYVFIGCGYDPAGEWTYGKALERARQWVAEHP